MAISAADYLPKKRTLASLRTAARGCHGCELYRNATQVVFGAGPASAPLMIVGEVPGDKEDQIGKPFVGPAGKLLDDAFAAAGIDRREISACRNSPNLTREQVRNLLHVSATLKTPDCRATMNMVRMVPSMARASERRFDPGLRVAAAVWHRNPVAAPPVRASGSKLKFRRSFVSGGHRSIRRFMSIFAVLLAGIRR